MQLLPMQQPHLTTLSSARRPALLLQSMVGPPLSVSTPQLRQRQPSVRTAAASSGAMAMPSEAAETAGTCSSVQAVLNLVNVMMGVGLLTLPYALNSSGWVGLLLLWLMGVVCNYTGEDGRVGGSGGERV